jgi:hypothetical protein
MMEFDESVRVLQTEAFSGIRKNLLREAAATAAAPATRPNLHYPPGFAFIEGFPTLF